MDNSYEKLILKNFHNSLIIKLIFKNFEMKLIIYSALKLGQIIKETICTEAKKDSINQNYRKKLYFRLYNKDLLILNINNKKYRGKLISNKNFFNIFIKNKNFLTKSGLPFAWVFLFTDRINIREIKINENKLKLKYSLILNNSIENILSYIFDRKKKKKKKKKKKNKN